MSERIPAAQRAPDNPRGYVHEPDAHPRADALPQEDLGILGRLRQAWPLLSTGAEKVLSTSQTQGVAVAGFRHSSPEPRVIRAGFPGVTAAERVAGTGVGAVLRLTEGVDTRGAVREVYVPLQGVAVAVPAGHLTAELLRGIGTTDAADNVCNVTVSAGILSRRWYADHWATVSTLVAVFPADTIIPAPSYATRARVTVTDGALGSSLTGVPIALAGQTIDLAIAADGTVSMSAAIANTIVQLLWEVSE
jgi:hypothetical protein